MLLSDVRQTNDDVTTTLDRAAPRRARARVQGFVRANELGRRSARRAREQMIVIMSGRFRCARASRPGGSAACCAPTGAARRPTNGPRAPKSKWLAVAPIRFDIDFRVGCQKVQPDTQTHAPARPAKGRQGLRKRRDLPPGAPGPPPTLINWRAPRSRGHLWAGSCAARRPPAHNGRAPVVTPPPPLH